jgi:hypothetical protein
VSAKKDAKPEQATKSKKGRKQAVAPQPEPAQAAPPEAPATSGGATTKLSALDAAERVLSEDGGPLGCKDLVTRMAAKGYWRSPAGKTPEATLCSAILREVGTKGEGSRFARAGRGLFALRQIA